MEDPALIIFDCDGTLTDSEYINNQALLDVLHEEGFTQYTLDHAYQHWVGTTVTGIMLSIQMETGRAPPADTVARYVKRVGELQQTSLRPVAGAADLVSRAAARFKVCVASNGERGNVLTSLSLCGLMDYFTPDTVFTKIQVRNPKPWPDLFLYAASEMGVEASKAVVIEDSETGVRAGVSAGMRTFGFTGSAHDPVRQEEALKNAGADRVFSRLIHIADALGI